MELLTEGGVEGSVAGHWQRQEFALHLVPAGEVCFRNNDLRGDLLLVEIKTVDRQSVRAVCVTKPASLTELAGWMRPRSANMTPCISIKLYRNLGQTYCLFKITLPMSVLYGTK
jgi:hypothetical protein